MFCSGQWNCIEWNVPRDPLTEAAVFSFLKKMPLIFLDWQRKVACSILLLLEDVVFVPTSLLSFCPLIPQALRLH